jgi:hypothetical protein
MENQEAISGYSVRIDWLKDELYKSISNCINEKEIRETIAWYFTYGLSIGIEKNDLIDCIKSDDYIYKISMLLTDDEILNGKKMPTLRNGDEVEVILNAKNLTFHKGIICDMKWHFNDQKWFYYIFENGKKISKRYSREDLKLLKREIE